MTDPRMFPPGTPLSPTGWHRRCEHERRLKAAAAAPMLGV